MSNPPFGFGLPDPNGDDNSGKNSNNEGADAFNQLGQMFSQLGQMMSQAGSSTGPVNYELAKQIALQNLPSTTETKIGFSAPGSSGDSAAAVRDAAHLA